MRLPSEPTIAREKLTRYLLTPRLRNDKSQFLSRAGYDVSNWRALEADLRTMARHYEAAHGGSNAYGEFWIVRGELHGPNGKILRVETVWISLAETGEVRFVTLKPDREDTK